jgi:pilus assembly protein CpaC
VDGVPGILTNRLHTHIDLSEPRTIALSGLIKQEQGLSQNGVWGLRNIPLLGALFESQDFRENRSELVIILRPRVMKEEEYAD